MNWIRLLLVPGSAVAAGLAGLGIVLDWPREVSATAAFVAAVMRVADIVYDLKASRKKAWRHVDALLVAMGEALDHTARVSLHLARGEELHCARRWSPSNGCAPASRPRPPLTSGIAWTLAFEQTVATERTLSTGLIPNTARRDLETLKQWHQKHASVSTADATKLGSYMLRVRSIECVKLKRSDHGTIGILTIDVHAERLTTRETMQQVTVLASVLERVLVDAIPTS